MGEAGPPAKKARTSGQAVTVDVSRESASWLAEEDGRRLRLLESLCGGKVEVSTQTHKVSVELSGDRGCGPEWADLFVRAMCCCHSGKELDVWPLEGADPSWSPELTVMDVPQAPAKPYIYGRGGARLLSMCEEAGVIGVFVEEVPRPEPKPDAPEEDLSLDSIAEGDLVEAKFGDKDRAFEAKVLKVSADKVTLKWTYDDDIPPEEVTRSTLVRKLPAPKDSSMDLAVGDLVEAKFGGKDRLFEAKVVKVSGSKVTVKWTYDDDVPEAEIDQAAVVNKLAPARGSKSKASGPAVPQVGDLVEAKFGNKDRWFEAEVLRVGSTTAKVRWTYDDDVPPSEVDLRDIKCRPSVETCKFHIYGPLRGRMELELRLLLLIETKMPGAVSNERKATDDTDDLGWSIVPLHNNGDLKAKVIGRGGCARIKVAKASGCALEYIGAHAWMVGVGQERARASALLDLLQTASQGSVEGVPEVLEAICTRVVMPQEASPLVTGRGRSTMNALEDDTGTLAFWVPSSQPDEPKKAKPGPTEGDLLEGLFRHPKRGEEWYSCEVLEVFDSGRRVKVRWDYDPDEDPGDLDVATETREIADGKAEEADKTLAIFGPERARAAVELRVKATVESKCPGAFAGAAACSSSSIEGPGFGSAIVDLGKDELSRCGKRREAAARAANCISEQVGEVLCCAGTEAERAKFTEYVRWLAAEKPSVPQAAGRDDLDELMVPEAKKGRLDPYAVEPMEQEMGTLCLFGNGGAEGTRRMVVAGQDAAKRKATIAKLKELQEQTRTGRSGADAWSEQAEPPVKRKFVVSKEEEERRKKRAARFATAPK